MIHAGSIGMPLHFGKVPLFLTDRMANMGEAIVESIVDNYGKSEVLTRLSDPNWFQALGAVMGMHWNSSGVTATVLGGEAPYQSQSKGPGSLHSGRKGQGELRAAQPDRKSISYA